MAIQWVQVNRGRRTPRGSTHVGSREVSWTSLAKSTLNSRVCLWRKHQSSPDTSHVSFLTGIFLSQRGRPQSDVLARFMSCLCERLSPLCCFLWMVWGPVYPKWPSAHIVPPLPPLPRPFTCSPSNLFHVCRSCSGGSCAQTLTPPTLSQLILRGTWVCDWEHWRTIADSPSDISVTDGTGGHLCPYTVFRDWKAALWFSPKQV